MEAAAAEKVELLFKSGVLVDAAELLTTTEDTNSRVLTEEFVLEVVLVAVVFGIVFKICSSDEHDEEDEEEEDEDAEDMEEEEEDDEKLDDAPAAICIV